MALRYVDAAATGAGNGTSFTDAWTTLGAITGVSAGDTVYIAGGTYSISNWQPAGGTAGNPITYQVAQDGTHSTEVTFANTGTQFLNGALSNVTIDGRYNGTALFTIDSDFEYAVYDPGGGSSMQNMKFLGWNFSSLIYCYGYGIEIGWCVGNAPLSGLDDSFIQHIGDDDSAAAFGINSIHDCVLTVPRKKTAGEGWDCIKWGKNIDVYNNVIRAVYNASYTGNQHNDAIQASDNYWRVYNNYFENFISYVFLNEIFDSSDSSHYRLYNNVIYYSDESGVDWTAQAVFAFGGNGGTTASASLTDVICANNTIISDAANTRGSFFCHLYPTINPPCGADCFFDNNCANDFTPVTQAGSGTITNSVNSATVEQVINKALYPTGDFRPTSGATAIIEAGIDPAPARLTDVFTTDKDGTTRVNPWDVGAYKFTAGTTNNITYTGTLTVTTLTVG